MKTEHHTLTKTWVVAALASLCCILWGSAIPMIKTGYRLLQVDDKHSQSDHRICRNKICVSRTFRLTVSIQEKKGTLPDGKILKYAVPVCLMQTVDSIFLLYRAWQYTSGVERWNHYRFRNAGRNPNVMFDRMK